MARRFGGLDSAQQFSRLYRVPNMGHCSGGAATNKFDLLCRLADWVEKGHRSGISTGDRRKLHSGRVPSLLHIRTHNTNASTVSLSSAICGSPEALLPVRSWRATKLI